MVGKASSATAARHLRAACISTLVSASFRGGLCIVALVGFGVGPAVVTAQDGTGGPRTSVASPATPVPVPPMARTASVPVKAVMPSNTRSAAKAAVSNPSWKELSSVQQEALSPLAAQWDTLDALHRAKWLQICRKFDTMGPDEKSRTQERMRAWVALTPEQRRVARDIYARTKKLNTDQKSAQWEQYQRLPEEQKRKLAAEAAKAAKVAALPPAHSKPKLVPPIKSLQKRTLQRSVSPQSVTMQTQTSALTGGTVNPNAPTGSAIGANLATRTPSAAEPRSVVTNSAADK